MISVGLFHRGVSCGGAKGRADAAAVSLLPSPWASLGQLRSVGPGKQRCGGVVAPAVFGTVPRRAVVLPGGDRWGRRGGSAGTGGLRDGGRGADDSPFAS